MGREDHKVVGQRLTFPFPFVHQQPHDCGNKTINRWETSLWNLSYNLSAVNLVSQGLRPLGTYPLICILTLVHPRSVRTGRDPLPGPSRCPLPYSLMTGRWVVPDGTSS